MRKLSSTAILAILNAWPGREASGQRLGQWFINNHPARTEGLTDQHLFYMEDEGHARRIIWTCYLKEE